MIPGAMIRTAAKPMFGPLMQRRQIQSKLCALPLACLAEGPFRQKLFGLCRSDGRRAGLFDHPPWPASPANRQGDIQ